MATIKDKQKKAKARSHKRDLQREELFVPYRRVPVELLLKLMSSVKKGELRFLDIGAGEGLISQAVLEKFPKAKATCIDRDEGTVKRGAERLRHFGVRVQFIMADIDKSGWAEDLHKTYNIVVSAYTLSHIDDDKKECVYRRIYEVLDPGGALFVLDRVSSPSPEAEKLYEAIREEHVRQKLEVKLEEKLPKKEFHEIFAAAPGSDTSLSAPLENQLRMLTQIGFKNVDCYWKFLNFALFGGYK